MGVGRGQLTDSVKWQYMPLHARQFNFKRTTCFTGFTSNSPFFEDAQQ